MIKIVHTADLHLGLEFSRYPSIANQLKEERLKALENIVKRANNEKAHAMVIAGDLFDKLSIGQKLVKETKIILATFNGEVFVIPGNHDWYNASANENKVWSWFEDFPGNNVHFLNRWQKYSFTLNNQEIAIYPCGCHRRHSPEHLITWVKDATKDPGMVNIGIAHGNVDGYGLDEEGSYFNMSPKELKEAGMDFWLLGHIHAPYPVGDNAGHEVFFFSGNHCSESWKSERPGGAWLIEIDDKKQVKATRWHHTGIVFKDRAYTINTNQDLEHVINELSKMKASQTVLRMTLEGYLTEQELEDAKTKIQDATLSFLHCELEWNTMLKITPDTIEQQFAKDTIPYMLLKSLSQDKEDALAMQLAYQTIKQLS
jgi:DNA repair exonuclease SbcCD nuclease subunit